MVPEASGLVTRFHFCWEYPNFFFLQTSWVIESVDKHLSLFWFRNKIIKAKAAKRVCRMYLLAPFLIFLFERPSSTVVRKDLTWSGDARCARLRRVWPLCPSFAPFSCKGCKNGDYFTPYVFTQVCCICSRFSLRIAHFTVTGRNEAGADLVLIQHLPALLWKSCSSFAIE